MVTKGSGSVGVSIGCGPRAQSHPLPLGVSARGRIELSEFSPRQTFSLTDSRIYINGVCAAITTVLHLALLAGAVWPNARATAHPHPVEGARVAQGQPNEASDLLWVADDEGGGGQSDRSAPTILREPPLIPISVTALVALLAANSTDLAERDERADSSNDSDSRAKIFGAYLGQIDARIDRAWIRPRIPIGDRMFLCHLLIDQDARGNVLEVTIDNCNGAPEWQQSLVSAVMSASPLPSPSDPAVFTPRVQMTFRESAPDEAVASTRILSDAGGNSALVPERGGGPPAAFLRMHRKSAQSVGSSSIDLRIEGSANGPERNLRPSTSNASDRMSTFLRHASTDAGQPPRSQQNH